MLLLSLWSRAVGVANAAICAAAFKSKLCPAVCPVSRSSCKARSLYWRAAEPSSLSDMGRADAASWKYGRPAGVAFLFQVRENKVEPAPANCRLNLLSKNDCRAALGDERKPRRPQVASVIGRLSRAGCGEGLAGARACPNRSVIGPAGESEGNGPSADAGEEMALSVSGKIVRPHVNDASLVNVTWRDVASGNEVAEPCGGIGVNLVVVRCHNVCFYSLDFRSLTVRQCQWPT
jgi:hypothetical protein